MGRQGRLEVHNFLMIAPGRFLPVAMDAFQTTRICRSLHVPFVMGCRGGSLAREHGQLTADGEQLQSYVIAFHRCDRRHFLCSLHTHTWPWCAELLDARFAAATSA
jgi:hypothetical protein